MVFRSMFKFSVSAFCGASLVLAGCGDDDGGTDAMVAPDAFDMGAPDVPETDAGPPEGTEVVFETYNLGLAGAFVPNVEARHDPIIAAVGALDADIVCLQEVWEQADKDAIVAAAAGNFDHILSHTTDLDTMLTSPEDQMGMVPDAYVNPPCGAGIDATIAHPEMPDTMINLSEALDLAVACLAENCSTTGDITGRTTSTSCAAMECVSVVAGLLFTTEPELQRCYGCIATSLPVENLDAIHDLCTTETNAGLSFRGQTSTMILSKFPLSNERNFVMPGTWNQRVVTVATATLPSGATVDVYCNHLTPVFSEATFPYTGRYGEDLGGESGWSSEQLLQANKVIELVMAESADTPAVILGDLNTGTAVLGEDLFNEAPATYERFSEVFTAAIGSDYAGICTYCSAEENPNNAEGMRDVWIDHIFMYNMGTQHVVSSERTFDVANIPNGMGVMVPGSDHYGYRATITIED